MLGPYMGLSVNLMPTILDFLQPFVNCSPFIIFTPDKSKSNKDEKSFIHLFTKCLNYDLDINPFNRHQFAGNEG